MTRRKPGRPGITDEQAQHVRDLLRRIRAEHFNENGSAFAEKLGLSASAVSQQISGKNRPSYDTVLLLGRYLGGVDPKAILAGTAPLTTTPDAFPARASALARLSGLLAPDVELRVRSLIPSSDDPPLTESEWIQLALRWNREHEQEERLRRVSGTRS